MEKTVQEKLKVFFHQFLHHSYRSGELLVRAEEDPSGVFYLLNGTVRVYAITKNGEELVVNIFKPGSFFPMSWAINQTPNKYFFEAMTDVELYRAPRAEVLDYLKQNPDVLMDLISRVYKGTDGLITRMTYLMAGNAYSRLIIELLIYVKRFGEGKNKVAVNLSAKELAAQSGLTRETVSRETKILKDRGIIHMDHNTLVVLDVQKLERELEASS